jgi:epoxyqueuosine reductase
VLHLEDPNPIVRGAAVWALARLNGKVFEQERAARLPSETAEDVQQEWCASLPWREEENYSAA